MFLNASTRHCQALLLLLLSYCIPFPATTAEVAELKNFTNFFKVLLLLQGRRMELD
jgi:hypothetical protein